MQEEDNVPTPIYNIEGEEFVPTPPRDELVYKDFDYTNPYYETKQDTSSSSDSNSEDSFSESMMKRFNKFGDKFDKFTGYLEKYRMKKLTYIVIFFLFSIFLFSAITYLAFYDSIANAKEYGDFVYFAIQCWATFGNSNMYPTTTGAKAWVSIYVIFNWLVIFYILF